MSPATYKFSVKEYHRMGETGILSPDQHFELIKGEIITMSPVGFKHTAAVRRITALSYKKFNAIISVQDPILLNDDSEPEPDVVLLKVCDDAYDFRLPEARDVLLLIEVSDSTLKYDRETKLPLYAASQIPECWIVNLGDRRLEIYREPTASGYQQKQTLKDAETISPIAFPEIKLTVAELLG